MQEHTLKCKALQYNNEAFYPYLKKKLEKIAEIEEKRNNMHHIANDLKQFLLMKD